MSTARGSQSWTRWSASGERERRKLRKRTSEGAGLTVNGMVHQRDWNETETGTDMDLLAGKRKVRVISYELFVGWFVGFSFGCKTLPSVMNGTVR